MFSQTADYALRAVVHLATHLGEPQTTQQIAEATKVSPGYLSKVLQSLGRYGIVRSQRGLHGGFVLEGSPDTLTVLDVVNVVDPIQRIKVCPLGLRNHGVRLCELHRRLDNALKQVEDEFRATTIRSIIADKNPSKPLCSS